jgi:hypothetical protein
MSTYSIQNTEAGWTIEGVEGTFKSRAGARAEVARLRSIQEAKETPASVTDLGNGKMHISIPSATARVAESKSNEEILTAIREAVAGNDIPGRNAMIRAARVAKIRRAEIAEAAGVSINYLQHILNPQPKAAKRPALTKAQQGYQEALADIAAQIDLGLGEGEALKRVVAWIENNRSPQAEAIFARAAAEHAA